MKLVIFDCDGTLVDSQHGIVASMNAAFESEGLTPPSRAKTLSVVGLSLDWAIESLLTDNQDPARVDRLIEGYKASFREWRLRAETDEPLYPGIRDLIEHLATFDGLALGVATGKSRRGLDAVLERERLKPYFATLQTADTHPSKPDPSMIHEAVNETGANIDTTMMIGDTTFDIEMARSAGASAIGVSWGYHETRALRAAGADTIVETESELRTAIEHALSLTR